MSLEFRRLGPLDVRRGGASVDLGPPKQRAVLALLLATAPRAVAVHELVEQIWGAGGPADPLRNIQVYVSNLRKLLGSPELITAAGSGYRLVVEADSVDLHRFEEEAARASTFLRRGSPDQALRAAKAALAWWRGPAWQDLRHLPALDVAAVEHEQARLDTEVLAARASLATGRHHDAVVRSRP